MMRGGRCPVEYRQDDAGRRIGVDDLMAARFVSGVMRCESLRQMWRMQKVEGRWTAYGVTKMREDVWWTDRDLTKMGGGHKILSYPLKERVCSRTDAEYSRW